MECDYSMFRASGILYEAEELNQSINMQFKYNVISGDFSNAGSASSQIKKVLKQLNVDSVYNKTYCSGFV